MFLPEFVFVPNEGLRAVAVPESVFEISPRSKFPAGRARASSASQKPKCCQTIRKSTQRNVAMAHVAEIKISGSVFERFIAGAVGAKTRQKVQSRCEDGFAGRRGAF